MISVMGCQGSKVQILSCRPKFPKKTNPLRLVFYACDLTMVKRWQNDGKTPVILPEVDLKTV